MFRKSIFAITVAALLGAAAATGNKDSTKTPHSGKFTTTNPNKVSGYDLCAVHNEFVQGSYVQGSDVTFTPVFGGACGTADAEQVGYFTSTCQANPYAGRASTYTRMSTGGDLVQNEIKSPCGALGLTMPTPNWLPANCPDIPNCFEIPTTPDQDAANCAYFPDGRSSYTEGPAFPLIPSAGPNDPVVNASVVQGLADQFCRAVVPVMPDTASMCKGELLLRGNHPKNRHPGSELVFDYSTVTTYEFVGSIYLTETQYSLGGISNFYIDEATLAADTVFTQVTCQFAPNTITTAPGVPFVGSGKYEKFVSKYISEVEVADTRLDALKVVANPYNPYGTEWITWETAISVVYEKTGPHYSML